MIASWESQEAAYCAPATSRSGPGDQRNRRESIRGLVDLHFGAETRHPLQVLGFLSKGLKTPFSKFLTKNILLARSGNFGGGQSVNFLQREMRRKQGSFQHLYCY